MTPQPQEAPALTPEDMKAAQDRADVCAAAVEAVLKEHRCEIVPVLARQTFAGITTGFVSSYGIFPEEAAQSAPAPNLERL